MAESIVFRLIADAKLFSEGINKARSELTSLTAAINKANTTGASKTNALVREYVRLGDALARTGAIATQAGRNQQANILGKLNKDAARALPGLIEISKEISDIGLSSARSGGQIKGAQKLLRQFALGSIDVKKGSEEFLTLGKVIGQALGTTSTRGISDIRKSFGKEFQGITFEAQKSILDTSDIISTFAKGDTFKGLSDGATDEFLKLQQSFLDLQFAEGGNFLVADQKKTITDVNSVRASLEAFITTENKAAQIEKDLTETEKKRFDQNKKLIAQAKARAKAELSASQSALKASGVTSSADGGGFSKEANRATLIQKAPRALDNLSLVNPESLAEQESFLRSIGKVTSALKRGTITLEDFGDASELSFKAASREARSTISSVTSLAKSIDFPDARVGRLVDIRKRLEEIQDVVKLKDIKGVNLDPISKEVRALTKEADGIGAGLESTARASASTADEIAQAEKAAKKFERSSRTALDTLKLQRKELREINSLRKADGSRIISGDNFGFASQDLTKRINFLQTGLGSLTQKILGTETALRAAKLVGDGFGKSLILLTANTLRYALQLGILAASFKALEFAASGFAFERSASFLRAILKETPKAIKQIESLTRAFAARTEFTPNEALEVTNILIRSNIRDLEVLKKAIPTALALSKIGELEPGTATNLVLDSVNQFGLAASEIPKIADTLVAATVKSRASLEDFANSLKFVGAVARGFGFEFKEVVAATAALVEGGLPGEKAGTGLRKVLTSLVKTSKESEQSLGKLGIRFFTIDGEAKSLVDIIEELTEKTKSLGTQGQQEFFSNVFNIRGTTAAQILIRNLEKIRELEAEVGSGDISALEVAGDTERNFIGIFNKFGAVLSEFSIVLKEAFAPTIFVDFLNVLRSVSGLAVASIRLILAPLVTLTSSLQSVSEDGIDGLIKNIDKLTAIITEAAVKIENLSENRMVKFTAQVVLLTLVLNTANKAMKAFNLTAASSSFVSFASGAGKAVGGLLDKIGARGAIASPFISVSTESAKATANISAMSRTIKNAGDGAGALANKFSGVFPNSGVLAGTLAKVSAEASVSTTRLSKLSSILKGRLGFIATAAAALTVASGMRQVGKDAEEAGEKIKKAFGSGSITSILDIIKRDVRAALDSSAGEDFIDGISNVRKELRELADTDFSNATLSQGAEFSALQRASNKSIKEFVKDTEKEFREAGINTGAGFQEGLTAAIRKGNQNLSVDRFTEFFSGLVSSLYDLGESGAEAFVSGITDIVNSGALTISRDGRGLFNALSQLLLVGEDVDAIADALEADLDGKFDEVFPEFRVDDAALQDARDKIFGFIGDPEDFNPLGSVEQFKKDIKEFNEAFETLGGNEDNGRLGGLLFSEFGEIIGTNQEILKQAVTNFLNDAVDYTSTLDDLREETNAANNDFDSNDIFLDKLKQLGPAAADALAVATRAIEENNEALANKEFRDKFTDFLEDTKTSAQEVSEALLEAARAMREVNGFNGNAFRSFTRGVLLEQGLIEESEADKLNKQLETIAAAFQTNLRTAAQTGISVFGKAERDQAKRAAIEQTSAFKDAQSLINSNLNPREQFKKGLENANFLKQTGLINPEQFNREIKRLNEEFSQASETATKVERGALTPANTSEAAFGQIARSINEARQTNEELDVQKASLGVLKQLLNAIEQEGFNQQQIEIINSIQNAS